MGDDATTDSRIGNGRADVVEEGKSGIDYGSVRETVGASVQITFSLILERSR
mgnify:FL=1